jgi:hypothetical protein
MIFGIHLDISGSLESVALFFLPPPVVVPVAFWTKHSSTLLNLQQNALYEAAFKKKLI